MPGYGYAAVAKAKSASWGRLVQDYLRGRPSLLRVLLLVDGRHGLKESDHETMRMLDAAAVSYAVVLTKRDEVKAADRERARRRDARGPQQACRGFSGGAVHLGAHRRGRGGAARAYRAGCSPSGARAREGRRSRVDLARRRLRWSPDEECITIPSPAATSAASRR